LLAIRSEQMRLLGLAALEGFKQDLLRHLAGFAPELHALRGDDVFRQVIDQGLARAAGYGFTNRGPLRFFVECMLSYGAEFDTDIQIRGLQECLVREHANGQEWHADQAFAAIERFQVQTRGRHNDYAIGALSRLGPFLDRLDSLRDGSLEADLLDLISRVYPEKLEFVGRDRLRRLMAVARDEAARSGMATAAGVGLLSGLMFALGHGIARDPLYPWVHATLTHPPAQDAARRIERLRRKTRIYLKATLANLPAR
jgi:hypothetical protein